MSLFFWVGLLAGQTAHVPVHFPDLFCPGVVGTLLQYLSPVSIAPTVALVGLSLTPIGAVKAGGDWKWLHSISGLSS